LRWILLLSGQGKERKEIADFRLQNADCWFSGCSLLQSEIYSLARLLHKTNMLDDLTQKKVWQDGATVGRSLWFSVDSFRWDPG
jgi:hypothetical protein